MLATSPDAYPQNLDLARGAVLVIRLDARAYRSASFLHGPHSRSRNSRRMDLRFRGHGSRSASRSSAPTSLHFPYRGHVGSTLRSRLLDETGAVLGLREPLPLRVVADAHDVLAGPESLLSAPQFDALLGMLFRLWSRGYDWTRAVVVKATSSAGRIAVKVLEASPASRAVYLSLRAEPYLATLLGGANSATDLRGHGPGRMRRLLAGRALPVAPLHTLSSGELAALGWLVESLSREDARRAHGTRGAGARLR